MVIHQTQVVDDVELNLIITGFLCSLHLSLYGTEALKPLSK
jgi:hypothetical protein